MISRKYYMLLLLATVTVLVSGFQPPQVVLRHQNCHLHHRLHHKTLPTRPSTTSLQMFMGSDGGILGIGGPELFTILLVGYFVLGPSDLYKLVKEIGKFIQNARTFSNDLTKTFENNMESQLQLEELRKAQRELTDAFSFRRTINVDEESEAFATTVKSPRPGDAVESAAVAQSTGAASGATTAVAATKKKKIRRRKRVVEEEETQPQDEMPDLEMPSTITDEDQALIDEEFNKYVTIDSDDPVSSRFQQQLSGNWNEQILQNEEKLNPLAQVMQKLALLEDEKAAANKRLDEEFARRAELEDQYYREQRRLLEEAAASVQKEAYIGANKTSSQ